MCQRFGNTLQLFEPLKRMQILNDQPYLRNATFHCLIVTYKAKITSQTLKNRTCYTPWISVVHRATCIDPLVSQNIWPCKEIYIYKLHVTTYIFILISDKKWKNNEVSGTVSCIHGGKDFKQGHFSFLIFATFMEVGKALCFLVVPLPLYRIIKTSLARGDLKYLLFSSMGLFVGFKASCQ